MLFYPETEYPDCGSFADLQNEIASRCGVAFAPQAAGSPEDEAKRASCDMTGSVALKYLNDTQPFPNATERRKFYRYCKGNMARIRRQAKSEAAASASNQDGPRVCKFAFLLTLAGAVFSWLVEKALDCWWSWYKQRHATGRAMAVMAAWATDPGHREVSSLCCAVSDDEDLSCE